MGLHWLATGDKSLHEYAVDFLRSRDRKQKEIMRQPDLAKLTSYDPDPLLAAVIERLNVKNDAELARALAISAPVISKIRHRKMIISANLLLRIHEITSLSIKELRVLMGDRRPVFS